MSDLIITRPGKETPGYLRRIRRYAEIAKELQAGFSVLAVDKLIEFLLEYVTEPADREQARELLLDCSEEQFRQLGRDMMGDGADPLS